MAASASATASVASAASGCSASGASAASAAPVVLGVPVPRTMWARTAVSGPRPRG